jgi:RNA polymerase sigma factor (sigma-70 family)
LALHAGTIKQSDSLGPWLHRVALRVAQKARRKACRDRARDRNRTEFGPKCFFYRSDLSFVPMLREEVSRLPDRYRRPVVLCYLEGKTNQEAAAQLKCPVGTIKGRLSRARQTLRNRLSRRGLDSWYPGDAVEGLSRMNEPHPSPSSAHSRHSFLSDLEGHC